MHSTGFVKDPFTLCTAFPRKDLELSDECAGECGVIMVEMKEGSPDILTVVGDIVPKVNWNISIIINSLFVCVCLCRCVQHLVHQMLV